MSDDTINMEGLTPKEQARLKAFIKQDKELIRKGYERVDLTTTVLKANTVGYLATLPFIAIYIILFVIFRKNFIIDPNSGEVIIFPFLMIIGIVIHECLHGLTWGLLSGKKFQDIEFGFIVKDLTPYCYCRSALSRGKYLLGLLMPLTVLGLILSGVSFIFNSFLLLITGIMMIFGTAGDLLIAILIFKNKPTKKKILYHDDPTKVGVVMYQK